MKLLFFGCALCTGAWCQNGSVIQQAPPKAAAKRNPMEGNERARRAGAKSYARECAPCHGISAEGSEKAPPLKRDEVYQAVDGRIFWILKNGSLYHGMPSFAHLPEAQRWQIVAFLRSLQRREE